MRRFDTHASSKLRALGSVRSSSFCEVLEKSVVLLSVGKISSFWVNLKTDNSFFCYEIFTVNKKENLWMLLLRHINSLVERQSRP